jgi:diacylglycerol kinase family enzyme
VITDQNGIAYERAQFALVINLAPWTYVGKFPISPIENSADTKSLDIFATYQMNISTTARLIKDLLSPRIMQSDSQTLVLTKQHSLKVSAYQPTWAQVDGEALAQVTNAQIEHFASCLTVIA